MFATVGILAILDGLKRLPWFEKHVEVHGSKEKRIRTVLVVGGVFVFAVSVLKICLHACGVF